MSSDMNALLRLLARPGGVPVQAEAPYPGGQSTTQQEFAPTEVYPEEGDWAPRPPQALEDTYPYDELPVGSEQDDLEIDPRFIGTVNRNPDGADAGPMYLSPEAEAWLDVNVFDRGYFVDWGKMEAFNEAGDRFKVPTHFPKMT